MKKIFFIIIFSYFCFCFLSEHLTSLQYSMGFGTGDMQDYIGAASFRGFTIGLPQSCYIPILVLE